MALHISNNKGMAATATNVALTSERKVAFLTVAGALTAVKAIWASVISRRSPLGLRGPDCEAMTVYGDPNAEYVVEKYTLAPGLYQWMIMVEPLIDAPYYLLLPMNDKTPAAMLVEVLNRHTLWPAREDWGKLLLKRGRDERLVKALTAYGRSLSWAYQVLPFQWEKVIDEAAKSGQLTFSD